MRSVPSSLLPNSQPAQSVAAAFSLLIQCREYLFVQNRLQIVNVFVILCARDNIEILSKSMCFLSLSQCDLFAFRLGLCLSVGVRALNIKVGGRTRN